MFNGSCYQKSCSTSWKNVQVCQLTFQLPCRLDNLQHSIAICRVNLPFWKLFHSADGFYYRITTENYYYNYGSEDVKHIRESFSCETFTWMNLFLINSNVVPSDVLLENRIRSSFSSSELRYYGRPYSCNHYHHYDYTYLFQSHI